MKIGIITVYHTENCGSALQATALAEKLRGYGHEVYFLSTKNALSGHSLKRLFKNCIKKILRFENFFNVIAKYINYEKYIRKNFRIITKRQIGNLDSIIIGSDTVWDVTNDYFLMSQDIFWARDIVDLPIISYAASIANSPYDKLKKLVYPAVQIKGYKAISVRDEYTKKFVELCGRQAVLTCDPTLLFKKEHYSRALPKKQNKPYLLLYLFNEPNERVKNEIINFSKKKKLEIISLIGMGKIITFADKGVESTIDNFLAYFSNAEYVITNTFHGTIFSLIFNKNFVVLDYKKKKIQELLNELNLSDRIINTDIDKTLTAQIDYDAVNSSISELRKISEKFLIRSLNE